MRMNENSLLATTDPSLLLCGCFLICFIGYICARIHRNTNDFAKSVKLYLPLMAAADMLFLMVFHLDIILVAGLDICGFAATALASNYYFYH